jgi:hypothetical protein
VEVVDPCPLAAVAGMQVQVARVANTRALSAEGVGGYANGANGASWPYANAANLSQMPRRRGGGV